MHERYRQGLIATAYCIERLNLKVFSPIVHSRPVIHLLQELGRAEHTFDYWRQYDINILRRCDELRVLCLDGWRESVGVTAEIKAATAIHLPTRFMTIELPEEWYNREKDRPR